MEKLSFKPIVPSGWDQALIKPEIIHLKNCLIGPSRRLVVILKTLALVGSGTSFVYGKVFSGPGLRARA